MLLDDDFFELDDDLLNASDNRVRTDGIIEIEDTQYRISLLSCIGEDSCKKCTFHEDSFIRNFDIRTLLAANRQQFVNEILFDLNLSEDILTTDAEVLKVLLNKARVNIQILHVSSRENATFVTKKPFLMRQQVTTLLFQLRQLVICEKVHHSTIEEEIRPISVYLDHLDALPISSVFHAVQSDKGNETISSAHHLLHGYLEWRWLHLTIVLKVQQQQNRCNELLPNTSLRDTEFEMRLKTFMYDLMVLSAAKFNKLPTLELPSQTPFACVCVKEMWLLLQLLIEHLHDDGDQVNHFWSYFNAIANLYRDGKSPYPDTKLIAAQRQFTALSTNNNLLFIIWMLNGVACVQGFTESGSYNGTSSYRIKENGEYLENIVRAFVNVDPLEQHLRAALLTLISLIAEWWNPKADILMLFWEYFNKKLNSSFFINGAAPNTLAVSSSSGEGYIKQIEALLEHSALNSNAASFSMFIYLLGRMLKRLVQIDMKNQVQKVTGRVFSKFSEAKLIALNEVGIHNVISLFLTLAMTISLHENGQRLQNILLQLRLDRIPSSRQQCMAKGHVALLIMHVDQRISIHSYLIRFLDQISAIGVAENKLAVMKVLFEGLDRLLMHDDYFECGEHLLVDSWLCEYLSLCTASEQDRCLQFADEMLKRSSSLNVSPAYTDQHKKLQQSLYKFVLPHLQNSYRQCTGLSNIPDIAANFCASATGQNGVPSFDDLFKYFTETICFDSQTSTKFLVSILSTKRAATIDHNAVIRQWIKSSMLSTAINDDLNRLTAVIIKLSTFQMMCNVNEGEILGAKEPLSVFFSGVGKTYDRSDEPTKRLIAEKLQACIIGFEKWTSISMSQQGIMKQFIVIALIILNCSTIVYARSRPNCFFNIAMNTYILPCSVLMGKQQKLPHIQAVLKVWHLIIGGIEKLDYQSDAHLQKIFNDMIVKWVPQFKWMPNQKLIAKPFISCMLHSQPSTATLIFDRIVTNFLSAQRRETHQYATTALNIFSMVLAAIENDAEKVILLVKCTIFTLMEHAMMVDDNLPSKKMTFDFLTMVFRSKAFEDEVELRQQITSNMRTLTTKYLSYHATDYFQFIQKIISIKSSVIKEILPHLKEQIGMVEELRGAGLDAKLRNALRRIEDALC